MATNQDQTNQTGLTAFDTETDGGEVTIETPPETEIAVLGGDGDYDGSRERKAHEENIAIVPEFDEYGYVGDRGSSKYGAISGSGRSYEIDPRGNGSCMDMSMHNPENGCKHQQRLMLELNRGLIPAPGKSIEEWAENDLYEWIVEAAEQREALETAQEKAQQADEPEYDPDDYDEPIEVTTAILTGLRDTYADYRERVPPDAPGLPEIAQADD
jgi:hypothetical protein